MLCTIFSWLNLTVPDTDYGRPMKPIFIEISKFWAWARQFGQTNFGVFPAKKVCSPKLWACKNKNPICQIFHQKKFQKVLMKIEEMADVFLISANFAKHTFFTLAPPSGYDLNLKALIKLAEHLSFHMKYLDLHLKENLIRQTSFLRKEHLPKSRIV